MTEKSDEKAEEARREARRATYLSWFWWVQVPLVCGVYWVVSKEPGIERFMLVYLAGVSIVANAVNYGTKAKSAEAKEAGYEHP